ncbi:MAG: Uma2 family endonuclease [Pyrinomonadaceae bacterium]
MGLAQPKTYLYSFEEYLKDERRADERSEFIDDEIYATAGESGAHGDISAIFLASLVVKLRGSECRARTKDTKVKAAR